MKSDNNCLVNFVSKNLNFKLYPIHSNTSALYSLYQVVVVTD